MSQNDVKQFVEAIRETIRQEVSKMSSDAVCEIESVNDDGTLNVYLLPDKTNIIRKIINQTRYNFNRGDYALLYLIKNRVSDSFVIAKYSPAAEDDIANYISKNDDSSHRLEEIGDTQIDLSDYVKKTTKIAGVDLENDITVEELSTALNLKALSHKDSVSGSYVKPTGSGSVSVADSWGFSGDKSNIVVPGQTINVPITNTTKDIGVTDVVLNSVAENFVDNVSSSVYDLNDGVIANQSDVIVTKQEVVGVSGSVTASNTTVKNGTAADWKANVTNETLVFSWVANKPTEVTATNVTVPVASTPIEVVTSASGSFVNSVSFRGNEDGNAYVVGSVGFTTGSAITSVSVETQPTLSEKTGGMQVVSSILSSSATIGQQTIEYTPSGTVSSAGTSVAPVTVETTTDTVISS